MAPIGKILNFNAQQQPDWLIITGSPLQFSPPIELVSKVIPGMPGALLQSKKHGPRGLQFECYIKADSSADLQSKADYLVNWLDYGEAKELTYSGWPNRAIKVFWTNESEFKKLIDDGEGALTFIAFDPYYYGPERPITIAAGANNINIGGNIETFPLIKATAKQNITFLNVVAADKVLMLGQPAALDSQTPTDLKPLILDDGLDSMTGWAAAGATVDTNHAIAGSLTSNGYTMQVSDYGTGNGWHGPAVKKTLSKQLTDFEVWVYVKFNVVGKKSIGRFEVYGEDQNGADMFKMALVNDWDTAEAVYNEMRIKGQSNGYMAMKGGHPDNAQAWNNFDGLLWFQKIGRNYYFWLGQVAAGEKYSAIASKKWYDADGALDNMNLSSITLHWAKWANFNTPETWGSYVKVQEILSAQPGQVPYIARTGDKIEIDTAKKVVYVNGQEKNGLFDPRGDYFPLKPGANALQIMPEGAADTTLTIRERYK